MYHLYRGALQGGSYTFDFFSSDDGEFYVFSKKKPCGVFFRVLPEEEPELSEEVRRWLASCRYRVLNAHLSKNEDAISKDMMTLADRFEQELKKQMEKDGDAC